MARPRALLRLLPWVLMAFLAFAPPLRAQLDPRLAVTPTDYLDLFQTSASTKIKPEILTIFDFSGSMASLMFHPLYFNTDSADQDSYNYVNFAMISSSATFTLKAYADGKSTAAVTYAIKLGATSSAGSAYNSGGWKLNAITVSPAGTLNLGSTVTFTTTLTAVGSGTDYKVDWVLTDSSGHVVGYWFSSSGLNAASSITLTVPYVLANYAVTPNSTVQTDLKALFPTVTMSTTLYTGQLVKPNGQLVALADAAGASTTSGQYGAGAGASDVRNWVRAASHVRFQYLDGTVLRTVDLPIPWKVMGPGSTGNPASSATVPDPVSTQNIETDLAYAMGSGDSILTNSSGSGLGSSTQTTCTLHYVALRPAYIAWVFQAKYLNGPNAGSYICYDAANPAIVGGQGSVQWGQGFGTFGATDTLVIPAYDGTWTYTGDTTVAASYNILPSNSRCQAVKRAAITTWVTYQTQVFWAYRFLDSVSDSSSTTTINISSTTNQHVPAGTISSVQNGDDSAWTLLNGNSLNGMQRIAALYPNNSTPLTYAIARGLAQFLDTGSVFNSVETGVNTPPQCLTHFLMLFTDGIDNNNSGTNNTNAATPYITVSGGTTGSALAGNQTLLGNKTGLDRSGSWWNLFTFAGAAAHLADTSLGVGNYLSAPTTYPTGAQTPDKLLPFAIHQRNGVIFQRDHRIQTMTVGVSLGGKYNDTSSPKRSLFTAAAIGDPTVNSWDLSALVPFTLNNPTDPSLGHTANSICYFDGTHPDALVSSLNSAFFTAIQVSNVGASSNPNLPFVGGTLGQEIYLGNFQPPQGGGVLWNGDVLMFSTRMLNGVPSIVDNKGNPLTTLTAANAQWSAASSLASVGWKGRNLWTRIPGNTNVPEPGLTKFSDVTPAYTVLKPYVLAGIGEPLTAPIPATDASKQKALQWAAGGDISGPLDASNRPQNTRNAILGDIIDSAPAALEYNFSQVSGSISAFPHISKVSGGNRFRLIIVGDNQGWVHGFGEVSAVTNVLDSSKNPVLDSYGNPVTIATGAVDELWAFMPTDFLGYLDYLETNGNPHRFMADGAPLIYFLDLPSTDYPNGNGVFDNNNNERAIAVIGLRKGGRSYYALNIANPFVPTLQWSLVPDEAALLSKKTFTDSTGTYPAISTSIPSTFNVPALVATMGFSTCAPALGRVQYNGYLKDAVFLGGGYSVSQVDHNFPTFPAPTGQNTPLGRSILALDVWTGQILAAADLTKVSATVGPVGSGLVPFEFFLGSGLAQRAYFMDLFGGLWCWDQNALNATAPYKNYRLDSSDLGTWTGNGLSPVRQVYQDSTGASALYTCMPAPFVLGSFPGVAHDPGNAAPAAVGIVMASGDRNNPVDTAIGYPQGTPAAFRLTTVFDRQDTVAWASNLTLKGTSYVITDANLEPTGYPKSFSSTAGGLPGTSAGDAVVTPGNAAYYLAPTTTSGPDTANTKFGYFINFPGPVTNGTPPPAAFIPKALTDPYVVSGSAFYSYFIPTTADPCAGGSGYTYTDILCDVLNPAKSASNASCQTGNALPFSYWTGVPSNFTIYGTRGVFQGGTVAVVNPPQGTSATQVNFTTLLNSSNNQYPKVRVWRVVH